MGFLQYELMGGRSYRDIYDTILRKNNQERDHGLKGIELWDPIVQKK